MEVLEVDERSVEAIDVGFAYRCEVSAPVIRHRLIAGRSVVAGL